MHSGAMLGGYHIVRKIRTGGMSTVYRAVKVGTGTMVALKVLHPELARDKGRLREFDNEACIASELSHPNIVRVFEYERDVQPPYFVMEYFKGQNLKVQMVRNREFVLCHMRGILLQAIDALDYLHAKRIIHCDIKPENLLVGERASVKLIDFALAREISSWLWSLVSRDSVRGTRHYMSPEQIRGKHLDHRSDIYSLGATMYDLYVGRPPFTGTDLDTILAKHLSALPVSMQDAGADIPPTLDRLVLQMLAKDPNERPQSMLAVRHALENL